MNNKNKIIASAKRTLSKEIKSIETLRETLDKNFYKAVEIIYNLKGKVIVTGIGKSAHIGNKISATLTSTGTPSYFMHATEASHGDLGSVQKKDCFLVISNSGGTSELSNIIEYSKRYSIPLISITSNSKGILYKNSVTSILYSKPKEACPLNLAPTSSTTMMLVIGDCIAISLLELKGFKSEHFKNFHPGGNLGKNLKNIGELMHTKASLPVIKKNENMSKALLAMTRKSFGCVGVVNNNNIMIGIITDGDLRRNLNSKLFEKKAHEIMTKKPLLVNSKMLVGEAINLMNANKITSLFISEKKKPIGIIHIHDLLRLAD